MDNRLVVSASPHLHKDESVSKIMWLVTFSLIPSGIAGVFIFGLSALRIILLGIISALFTECILQLLTKRKVAIFDGSAFLTGLLLAYNLPPRVPFWIPLIGSAFAIAIGKQVFGGLGQNIFNPALAGRVFLMASWPKYITTFTQPLRAGAGFTAPLNYDAITSATTDAVTSATPLAMLKEGKILEHISYLNLFLGRRAGCIGEVCIIALLIGAAFLLWKGYISWHIPGTYVLTTALFTYIFAGKNGLFTGDAILHVLSGGLILGAFFMATDYVTSPLTQKGQMAFGAGCGLLTAVIRIWGGYPEGASYAILMMNAATPIIDRFTKKRIYGKK